MANVTDSVAIRQILDHLDLSTLEKPPGRGHAGPPTWLVEGLKVSQTPRRTSSATLYRGFNGLSVNLGTPDLEVAKRITKAIRFGSGGFRFVKATGVMLQAHNLTQVSINMTYFKKTPLARVFETLKAEAARYGVPVVGSEIVGLVPAEAFIDAADHFLRLERFDPSQVLERRIREAE